MTKETNTAVTYKFFSKRGNRLSVFARNKDAGVELVIFKCSKREAFNKSLARSLYIEYTMGNKELEVINGKELAKYKVNPDVIQIALKADQNIQAAMMEYCNENFIHIEDYAQALLEKFLVRLDYNVKLDINKLRALNKISHTKIPLNIL
jgi:hypothetical protein